MGQIEDIHLSLGLKTPLAHTHAYTQTHTHMQTQKICETKPGQTHTWNRPGAFHGFVLVWDECGIPFFAMGAHHQQDHCNANETACSPII